MDAERKTLLAEGMTEHACTGRDGRPVRPPEWFVKLMRGEPFQIPEQSPYPKQREGAASKKRPSLFFRPSSPPSPPPFPNSPSMQASSRALFDRFSIYIGIFS